MGFVPLHNHSDYSLLDGASQLPKMVNRAQELGIKALALTDHGVMYGALELLKDIEADEVMFNSLLDGCAKQQARELLTNAGVVPSNFTLSIMIKLFGRTRHRSFRLGSGTYYRVQFPAEHASLHVGERRAEASPELAVPSVAGLADGALVVGRLVSVHPHRIGLILEHSAEGAVVGPLKRAGDGDVGAREAEAAALRRALPRGLV